MLQYPRGRPQWSPQAWHPTIPTTQLWLPRNYNGYRPTAYELPTWVANKSGISQPWTPITWESSYATQQQYHGTQPMQPPEWGLQTSHLPIYRPFPNLESQLMAGSIMGPPIELPARGGYPSTTYNTQTPLTMPEREEYYGYMIAEQPVTDLPYEPYAGDPGILASHQSASQPRMEPEEHDEKSGREAAATINRPESAFAPARPESYWDDSKLTRDRTERRRGSSLPARPREQARMALYTLYDPYTSRHIQPYERISFKRPNQWRLYRHELDDTTRTTKKVIFGKKLRASKEHVYALSSKRHICRGLEVFILEGNPTIPRRWQVADDCIVRLARSLDINSINRSLLKIMILDGCPAVSDIGFRYIIFNCPNLEYLRVAAGGGEEFGEVTVLGGITDEPLRMLLMDRKLVPKMKELVLYDQQVSLRTARTLTFARSGLAVQVGFGILKLGQQQMEWHEGPRTSGRQEIHVYFDGEELRSIAK